MGQVVFVHMDGTKTSVSVDDGDSIMSAAVDNNIHEIVAECGGAGICGTCHCYVDPKWIEKLEPPDEFEEEMLRGVISPKENSRLSCQIEMSEAIDGLVVHLPADQF